MRCSLVFIFSLLLGLPQLALGWGREGHREIAHIASNYLNAKSRAEIARLLGPSQTIESIASWADEVRPQRKETSTWHYIDLPITVSRTDWHKYCPKEGCILTALPQMIERLGNKSLPDAERAEALKFVVHFVGDMHQPLHSGENGDKGGNSIQVIFQNKPTNLHSAWDYFLLEAAMAQDVQLKSRLERSAGFWSRRSLQKGTLEDWAWQAHDLSRDVVYAALPQARPAPLGADYLAKATPVIEQQIRRGGVRLAKVLNDCLGR